MREGGVSEGAQGEGEGDADADAAGEAIRRACRRPAARRLVAARSITGGAGARRLKSATQIQPMSVEVGIRLGGVQAQARAD